MDANEVYNRFKQLNSLQIDRTGNYVQDLYDLSKGIRELTEHLEQLYRQKKEIKPEYMKAFLTGLYVLQSKLSEGLDRYGNNLGFRTDDIKQGVYTQRQILDKLKDEENPEKFLTRIDGTREYADQLEKRLLNVLRKNKTYAIASLAISLPLLAFFASNQELTARAISPSMSSASISFTLIIIILASLMLLKDRIYSMLKKVLQFSKRV
ncbi:MAG: hypothetical protein N3D75_02600 [Candidatus Aenigmarchaeota archaeon]|nr:hypothetical protein [Candidatus Aenigmarchaeota archaeon]